MALSKNLAGCYHDRQAGMSLGDSAIHILNFYMNSSCINRCSVSKTQKSNSLIFQDIRAMTEIQHDLSNGIY